jgi:lipopolysaccharide transport system permease protein
MLSSLVSFFTKYWALILFKAKCDLRVENSKAKLGVVWWYLEPALYLLCFYSIKSVMRVGDSEGYVLFILTGIVFWRWFDSTIRNSAGSLIKNTPLASQVYLPKIIFPMVTIAAMFYRFLILLLIFFIAVLFLIPEWHITLIYVPIMLVVQFVLVSGLGIFLSAVVPFVPDIQIVLNNLLMMMFFTSGIFFDISTLSPEVIPFFMLNPMVRVIDINRSLILYGEQPLIADVFYVLMIGVLFFIAGLWIHLRFDRRYPKILLSH